MELVKDIPTMRQRARQARCQGKRLALVPTMGALHRGHLTLVEEACRRADHVTVSIFVNPTQFGPNEDYERYPRTLEADIEALQRIQGEVDVVFCPSVQEMYPPDYKTWVYVEDLDRYLCGAHRPGHFRGVTTVVTKLFHACEPDVAVFGLKDAQQFVILRRMVEDLNFGIEMVGVPTVREADGLALSSRNLYLTAEQRQQAVVLSRAIFLARRLIEQGERDAERIKQQMQHILATAPDAEVQYVEVVDGRHLEPVRTIQPGQEVLVALAVFFGGTRLIDSAFVRAPETTSVPDQTKP